MLCLLFSPRSTASGVPTTSVIVAGFQFNYRELFVVASAVAATSAVENMEG